MLPSTHIVTAAKMVDLIGCQIGLTIEYWTRYVVIIAISIPMLFLGIYTRFEHLRILAILICSLIIIVFGLFILGFFVTKIDTEVLGLQTCLNPTSTVREAISPYWSNFWFDILTMIPLFTFTYDFENSILPVNNSFQTLDKRGIAGMKTVMTALACCIVYFGVLLTMAWQVTLPSTVSATDKVNLLVVIYYGFPKYIAIIIISTQFVKCCI